jgi:hypothetical protein
MPAVERIRTIVVADDVALGQELLEAIERHARLELAGASPTDPRALLLARSSGAQAAVVGLGIERHSARAAMSDLVDIDVEHVLVASRGSDVTLERKARAAARICSPAWRPAQARSATRSCSWPLPLVRPARGSRRE